MDALHSLTDTFDTFAPRNYSIFLSLTSSLLLNIIPFQLDLDPFLDSLEPVMMMHCLLLQVWLTAQLLYF
ncbi:MAG: hypothetical protein J3Q66DRAFT_338424 [Benniella sp.]|nr:MAG: hypothetical protein J3Q66DRAFT_338424 [Benniella sp.]